MRFDRRRHHLEEVPARQLTRAGVADQNRGSGGILLARHGGSMMRRWAAPFRESARLALPRCLVGGAMWQRRWWPSTSSGSSCARSWARHRGGSCWACTQTCCGPGTDPAPGRPRVPRPLRGRRAGAFRTGWPRRWPPLGWAVEQPSVRRCGRAGPRRHRVDVLGDCGVVSRLPGRAMHVPQIGECGHVTMLAAAHCRNVGETLRRGRPVGPGGLVFWVRRVRRRTP